MQEPYDEELAIYIDLELCTLIRKDWGEALTKACAGLGIEPRKDPYSGC